MSSNDKPATQGVPDAIRDGIAALVPTIEQMPPRERSLLEAIAMWRNGYSMRAAAAAVDLHHSSLSWRIRELGLTRTSREQDSLDLIEQRSTAIFDEASSQLTEALEAGKIAPSQLAVTAGIYADKLTNVAKLRQGKDQTDAFAQVLEKLAGLGGKLTLAVPDPADRAIDITPDDE